jgi:RNA polymerase sigma factor (sigma-70 family)
MRMMFINARTETECNTESLFNEIWEQHHSYIEKLCSFKLSSHPDLAEDCVQKVFMALFKALQSGTVIEKPKAWLSVTAYTIVKMEYQAMTRERELKERALNSDCNKVSYEVNYLDTMITDEKIDALTSILIEHLAPQERDLLLDVYWKNRKLEALSKRYGISKDALYQRLHRLRCRVHTLVKELINDV